VCGSLPETSMVMAGNMWHCGVCWEGWKKVREARDGVWRWLSGVWKWLFLVRMPTFGRLVSFHQEWTRYSRPACKQTYIFDSNALDYLHSTMITLRSFIYLGKPFNIFHNLFSFSPRDACSNLNASSWMLKCSKVHQLSLLRWDGHLVGPL
jgi:hypothetical protein